MLIYLILYGVSRKEAEVDFINILIKEINDPVCIFWYLFYVYWLLILYFRIKMRKKFKKKGMDLVGEAY